MKWNKTSELRPNKSGAVLCFFNLKGITAKSVEWYSASQDDFLPLDDGAQVLNTPTHWSYLLKDPK